MKLVIDTNVVIAYVLSPSPGKSSNFLICDRIINEFDSAYINDALYGELMRHMEPSQEFIDKLIDDKTRKIYKKIKDIKPEYKKARFDPYRSKLNFVETQKLDANPEALSDVGNDWHLISIANEINADYIITHNLNHVLKYSIDYDFNRERVIKPVEYMQLIRK